MNSIQFSYKMNTIFMKSENSKTSGPRRLLLNFTDKINLKRSDKFDALSNLSIYYPWRNIKKLHKRINLKYQLQLQCGKITLNYLTDHILNQIFKTIFSILSKNMEH